MTRLALALALALPACGGGSGKPVTPAPIGNAADPAPAATHPAIDGEGFDALVASKAWDTVIDPATGVVEMSAVSTAGENAAPPERWVKRRCGDRAATFVGMLAVKMQMRRLENPEVYQLPTCAVAGSAVLCTSLGAAEYDLTYEFRFEARDGRTVLTGVSTVDVGTVAAEETKNYDAELAKTGGC